MLTPFFKDLKAYEHNKQNDPDIVQHADVPDEQNGSGTMQNGLGPAHIGEKISFHAGHKRDALPSFSVAFGPGPGIIKFLQQDHQHKRGPTDQVRPQLDPEQSGRRHHKQGRFEPGGRP